jgi:dTDP-glucose 4,6-dehydratase/UDP-glucuronate decarboxylase
VSDAAAAMAAVLLADAPGEIFNVGNDEEVSIGDVARVYDEVSGNNLGVKLEQSEDPEYLTDNPQRRCPDLSRIKKAIDWEPLVSLRHGVERTLEFYRNGVGG